MTDYEYSIIQMAAGTRVTMFNERLEHSVREGWEPFMMSGDTTINIMLRRPRQGAEVQQAASAAGAVAAPRPAAPAAQVSVSPPQVAAASASGALNQQ